MAGSWRAFVPAFTQGLMHDVIHAAPSGAAAARCEELARSAAETVKRLEGPKLEKSRGSLSCLDKLIATAPKFLQLVLLARVNESSQWSSPKFEGHSQALRF